MDKETGKGRMGTVDLLQTLLTMRPNAILILRVSNALNVPVSDGEIHARLENHFATLNIDPKRWPSELEVKNHLGFLAGQNLLEVVEGGYQNSPRGAEVARELSPRSETGSVKAS